MLKRLLFALLLARRRAGARPSRRQPASPAAARPARERVVALAEGRGAAGGRCSTPPSARRCRTRRSRASPSNSPPNMARCRGWRGSTPASAQAGVIHVRYARAIVHMQLAVEPAAPHLISGLLLTGADMQGDTMAAVLAELRRCRARSISRSRGSATARPVLTRRPRAGPAAGDRLDLQTVHPRRAEPAGAGGPAALERRRARSTAARSAAARSQASRAARRSPCTRSPR